MLNTKTIGNKIAQARKKLNISQAQLAEQLFISPQAVGKWERGESFPDIITFNQLAKVLGVDLNHFSDDFPSPAVETPGNHLEQEAGSPSRKQEKKPSWDMSRGNWVDADFSGLTNLHEKFGSSNLQRCIFIDSNLSGLLLKNNHVERCDFRGSNMNHSHIQNSHLAGNLFQDCSMQDAEFSGSHIKSCNFSGADLTGAVIKSTAFEKIILTNALLKRAAFSGTHMADIVFDGIIEDCTFENCAFSRVTFQSATLINTFFKNQNLKRVRFTDCKADRITYEFLKAGKADLEGITLIT